MTKPKKPQPKEPTREQKRKALIAWARRIKEKAGPIEKGAK